MHQVLINGRRVVAFDRDAFTTLALPPGTPGPANGSLVAGTAANPFPNLVLDILVSAVGRQNSRTTYDTKGLSSPDVLLNGASAQASQRLCCCPPGAPCFAAGCAACLHH